MILTSQIIRKSLLTAEIIRKSLLTSNIVRKSLLTSEITMNAPPPAPYVLSAEVGLIDAYTIDVLLSLALNESKIPDAADLIPAFSGGATQIYDRTITGLHLYAKTGIDSWYLPSKDELNLMYVNLHLFGVGDFSPAYYWSSSEYNFGAAADQSFLTGIQYNSGKSDTDRVRSCRSFTSLKTYALRDTGPAGGLIFYKDGNNYLEVSPSDQSTGIAWSNITLLIGTTGTAIGTGQANTTAIIGQSGFTAGAAKLCNDLVIGRAITAGETGTFQYIPNALQSKKLTGLNGGLVAAFTKIVTNNVSGSTQPVLSPPILIEDLAPTKIKIPYDLDLDETSIPAVGSYVLGSGRLVSLVEVSGKFVYLTPNYRYYYGDTETVAYTKPGTNMIKSTLGGEADSFTATAVTNQVAQLAFQNANTKIWGRFQDLNTITKDGSNLVSVWADRQGSGRNLLQADGAKQPLLTADGILFNGIDEFMKAATFPLAQPTIMYILFRQITWTLNDVIFDGYANNTGKVYQAPATPKFSLRAAAVLASTDTSMTTGKWGIARVTMNGANSSIQIDNNAANVGDAGTLGMAGLTLGSNSAGFSNIEVAEFILRNSLLVEAETYAYLETQKP